jgi:hypothetical protein
LVLVNGATSCAGDPFTLVTDGINMSSGRYMIYGSVYWDGFNQAGEVAIGGAAGQDLFKTSGLNAASRTQTICVTNWSPGYPAYAAFLSTVYLWARPIGTADMLGSLNVMQLI